MNAVAKIDEARPRSVLVDMAHRYGMEPAAFEATVRATVVPASCSKEQFAAFLLVAKEYRLNPLTKEIYAFPAKGGGIQPIVSIDGWARIINERPELTGIEFEDLIVDGKLVAITAKIHRSDRTIPISVTEYMEECRRSTDTWKQWPARMLRHKALIQCSRYAFGFSGIVDPDEYERIVDVTPGRGDRPDIRARLPGPGHVGGFAVSNVDTALPDHDPQTGEIIDAQIDPPAADELPVRDDTPPADDFPGDRSAPREPDAANNGAVAGDFDVIAWAAAFVRSLPGYAAVDPMREDWQAHKDELRTKSPALFKEANRAVADRAAEIAGA